jgi:two-component system nitrogen regulation response regulator GlnG
VQVKLLRVLEQHEVTPVGSTQSKNTAFRVIAATSRDVGSPRDGATLRSDLYFRLAAFEIAIPPLRERVDDIPLLAEAFLRRVEQNQPRSARFSEAAIAELCRRPWPGNVRQLRHAVEHGRLLARGGQIGVEHLPPPLEPVSRRSTEVELEEAVRAWTRRQLGESRAQGHLYQAFLSQVEPSLFQTVLSSTTGNRAAAADALGIHRATLRKKLAAGTEES